MRFLDEAAVHRLAPYGPLVDALAEAHRQAPPLVGRALLKPAPESDCADQSFLVLPAWSPGRAWGVKMATIVPGNAEVADGPPTVQPVYQLFDGATGSPAAAIEGTALTLRKTAADSALGARLLAREDVRTMLMIGAGALAPHLIEAHMTVRPSIGRVLIWNRSVGRRDAQLVDLRNRGFPIEPVDDLEAAVRQADVISAATMATEPLIQGGWLKPGTHVDLVGGFTPEMREADDEAVRRSLVFIDFPGSTIGEAGDITQPMANGVLSEADIQGDLFDLCQGRRPGRRGDEEITLYKNGGGGHLDLFTAEFLFHADRDNGG